MSASAEKRILFVFFVLYRLLCAYLIFPLAKEAMASEAFYAMRTVVRASCALLCIFMCLPYFYGQYQFFCKNLKTAIITISLSVGMLVLIQLTMHAFIDPESVLSAAEMKADPFGTVCSALLISPLLEELVFRVCLYDLVQKHSGRKAAFLVTSFVFGLFHVIPSVLAGQGLSIILLIMFTLCGAVLQASYQYAGFFGSMLSHSLFNLLSLTV